MEQELSKLLLEADKTAHKRKLIIGWILILAGLLIFAYLLLDLYIYCRDFWNESIKWQKMYPTVWDFYKSKDGTIAVYALICSIPVIAGILTICMRKEQ